MNKRIARALRRLAMTTGESPRALKRDFKRSPVTGKENVRARLEDAVKSLTLAPHNDDPRAFATNEPGSNSSEFRAVPVQVGAVQTEPALRIGLEENPGPSPGGGSVRR
jgi:hypothetical protein